MQRPGNRKILLDELEQLIEGKNENPLREYFQLLEKNRNRIKYFWMLVNSGKFPLEHEKPILEYIEEVEKYLTENFDPDTLYEYEFEKFEWEEPYKHRQFWDNNKQKIITKEY